MPNKFVVHKSRWIMEEERAADRIITNVPLHSYRDVTISLRCLFCGFAHKFIACQISFVNEICVTC